MKIEVALQDLQGVLDILIAIDECFSAKIKGRTCWASVEAKLAANKLKKLIEEATDLHDMSAKDLVES